MKIYNMEECQQWIEYSTYYSHPEKQMLFKPLDQEGRNCFITPIINLNSKCFQHDIERIKRAVNIIEENYPKLSIIKENLNIFLNPKPSVMSSNASALNDTIVYHARGTQIPHYMTDYITGHELGHLVQFKFCDKYDRKELFREYLKLRNAPFGKCMISSWIDGKTVSEEIEDFYFLSGKGKDNNPEWDDSPLEWFAEDFRYFFGVTNGEPYWGLPIELPTEKVKDFILSL